MPGAKVSDAQTAMDRLLGVKEPQIIVPRDGNAKRRHNVVYTQALAMAQKAFPNDGVAAHRAAMRMANRAARTQPVFPRTPSEEERKVIDAGLLEAFPEDTAGDRGRLSIEKQFPDYILARGEDGELYKISYTMKDGVVGFGAPEEIEDGPEDETEGSGAPQGK